MKNLEDYVGILKHLQKSLKISRGRSTRESPSVLLMFASELVLSEPSSVEGETGFKCLNRRCVKASYVCDGTNDCGDWSDENTAQCAGD